MRAPAIKPLMLDAGSPARGVALQVGGGAQPARAASAGSVRSRLRRFLSFAGPGAIVAVGYIDPGNWAADLAGGSRFAYGLLSVVLASGLMAMLLQALCVRLGIASGQDLAEACRDAWPRAATLLWALAEVAVAATDLAEVLGSAIALELLFRIPLAAGVVLTSFDVLLLLGLERGGGRRLDACVAALVLVVVASFVFELALCRPEPASVLAGYLPSPALFRDRELLYLAVAILGATVMPHNLYLHSSLVKTRVEGRGEAERRSALRHATLDTVVSLSGAIVVNSAILVLAAAVFHRGGHVEIADLRDAHRLLSPLLGSSAAVVFAVALLAAGQSATLTGTMAGQVVMTGFLRMRLRPWARRLCTRSLALGPALGVVLLAGGRGTAELLVASQVILSLALPFAVLPLLRLTADRRRMGALVSPRWMTWLGWASAGVILGLNAYLLAAMVRG
jgi:manganese transport protein